MSVKVDLEELSATLANYGWAYLVTVSDNAKAHVLAVSPTLSPGGLSVAGVGRHSQANATTNPNVTLAYPPTEAGGYTLLVDGTATVANDTIIVAPTKAILHRPAPGAAGQRIGSDCVEIPLS